MTPEPGQENYRGKMWPRKLQGKNVVRETTEGRCGQENYKGKMWSGKQLDEKYGNKK